MLKNITTEEQRHRDEINGKALVKPKHEISIIVVKAI
jgi:hypothetical protein